MSLKSTWNLVLHWTFRDLEPDTLRLRLRWTVRATTLPTPDMAGPIAKRLMPAKTLAKFRICSARDTTTGCAGICPFATEVFTPETLVNFLGGLAPSTEKLGPVDRPKVPAK